MARKLKFIGNALGMILLISPVAGYSSSPGELANEPLFLGGGRGVPGNMVLTPSVEYPTIQSLANLGSYSSGTRFEGYFDPGKCYKYSYDATNESARHFYPSSLASSRTCSGADEWSGNFLNWAVTQTIDPFRKVLTGGLRVKDTTTETWLEKARHPGQSGLSTRELVGSTVVAGATPFTANKVSVRIAGLETDMRFSLNDNAVSDDVDNAVDYDPNSFNQTEAKSYLAKVRVKVCDASVGLESNCKEYQSGWKPEGLIQKNADTIRYSVFGYLNQDGSSRDGGVLRARQKYVGPEKFESGTGMVDNPRKEWDPVTGQLIQNPDSDDASATPGTITNSGVINYINKFGQLNSNDHKSQDPVSELYYAATRFLKNQGNVSSYTSMTGVSTPERTVYIDGFPVIENWEDPFLYECQPSVVLGIGDVNTWQDKNLPGNTTYRDSEPTMPSEVSSDNTVNVITATNRVGIIEDLGTTLGETNSFTGRANSAYIAGLAYDNHTQDIRPDLSGKQTVSTHWVDVLENQALKAPANNQYYLAAKYGGFDVPDDFDAYSRTEALSESWWHTNNETLTIGSTSFKRPDNYYVAGQADKMISSLEQAFENILTESIGSASGVTFNTALLEADNTLLFGAKFDSTRWSGELFANALIENESGPPTISESESWEASALLDTRDLDSDPRQIITFNGSAGVPFSWTNLTEVQKNDLRTGVDDVLAQARVNFLRGYDVDDMRIRDSRLGDIVHSTPVYVGNPSLGWPNAEPFGITGNTYADFREEQQSRNPVVYVGANDGMLHAFSAETGTNAGRELFGYIPSFLYSDQAGEGLHYLTEPGYQHRFYNDLSPVVTDAYIAGPGAAGADWRTVLIGGARTGAKGIFALDITNPTSFGESNADDLVLWEFSGADDTRMGHIIEPPSVGLAKWGNNDFRWTAFFGNGYNSSTAATGIFMLDLEGGLDGTWTEGSDYRFISFETGVDASGASPVRQLDLNGDRIIDRLYAGDLNGKMWVASVSNNGTWSSPYTSGGNAVPLFTAEYPSDPAKRQPITAAPMVVRNPDNNESNPYPDLLVLFGTGQYLTQDDPTNADIQSFYGVLDSGASGLGRADLVGRTLSQSSITVEGVSYQVRESNGDDLATEDGWYVDFDSATDAGERINQSPQVRGDYVFVNSIVPSDNPCDVGGGGWLMAFGLDGKTPDRAVWPKLGAPYVGYRTEGGLPNKPGFLGDFMFTPRSDNEILADEIDVGRKETSLGRMSWQELYD